SPALERVEAIGFLAPRRGGGSKDCIRLDRFEVHARGARIDPTAVADRAGDDEGFFEPGVVVRSAVLVGGDTRNRVRRGLVVPIGGDVWACFDPDLLRWAGVWRTGPRAAPLTLDSMAATSYPDTTTKAQRPPRTAGEVLAALPELPGGNLGTAPLPDPRTTRTVDAGDPVGPLPRGFGRFEGFDIDAGATVVRYRVGEVAIEERVAAGVDGWTRELRLAPCSEAMVFRVDARVTRGEGASVAATTGTWRHLRCEGDGAELRGTIDGVLLQLRPSATPRLVRVVWSESASQAPTASAVPLRRKWPVVRTDDSSPADGIATGPLAVRNLALPDAMRAGRTVRPVDIAFLPSGEALLTTLDGDVWRVTDLGGSHPSWRRAAAGLAEPLDIETDANGRVFVLGRDQVTELVDRDRDGVFDRFDNAGDAFLQTLHTRDFATSLAIESDGSLLVAKGGIWGDRTELEERSIHRGAILRLTSDGGCAVLADGLRLPFLGMRSDGAIFASDQQGHFVPTTPVYRIDGGDGAPAYGHEPTRHRVGGAIDDAMVWFPYRDNRSGAGFATLSRRAFPSLGDAFVHVSWNGALFGIATPAAGVPFAWRLPAQLDFPSLKAASHPHTGALFVVGLGISGYQPATKARVGLCEVRERAPLVAPASLRLSPERVVVEFAQPLPAAAAIEPVSLRVWSVRRSKEYGSGHYRWDGEPGEQVIEVCRFALRDDRSAVELDVAPMFAANVLALTVRVAPADGTAAYDLQLFANPAGLPKFVDGAARAAGEPAVAVGPGDAARGEAAFVRYACVGCHSRTGQKLVGPPLDGVAKRHGGDLVAFLRRSILMPAAEVTPGYEAAMPSFDGVIPQQELADLIEYLRRL
ncbi:MAG: hypothetical protein RL398_1235, partial [Planctomycetota bacterium]